MEKTKTDRNEKLDKRNFFFTLERHARQFLQWYENKAKARPAEFAQKMKLTDWWKYFRAWEKEIQEHAVNHKEKIVEGCTYCERSSNGEEGTHV